MKQMLKRIFNKIRSLNGSQADPLYCTEYIDYEKIDNTPKTEEAVVLTLNKGLAVLDQLKVKYALGRGSILGLHRDGKFLRGDNDIDIDVFSDKEVYEIIKRMPFEIILITSNKGRYMQLSFLDKETNVIFDIWFYHLEGNELRHRNFFGYFWLPAEKFERLGVFRWKGLSLPAPIELDWYCNFWYGDSWKTPKSYKGHWTLSYKEDCKGFIFTDTKDLHSRNFF